jgi:hypothetical protein
VIKAQITLLAMDLLLRPLDGDTTPPAAQHRSRANSGARL